MHPSRTYPILILSFFIFGACPDEASDNNCEINCSLLEYCGANACDACPALCTSAEPNTADAGNNEIPVTIDAGNNETPVTTDAGNNETPVTTDAGNNETPDTTDAGNNETPVTTDAGTENGIACANVLSLKKSWGGTSGPCGPVHVVSIQADGTVTQYDDDAYPPEGETTCADTVITHYTANAADARALIDLVCADYNTNYTPIDEMCVGAYSYWSFALPGNSLATTSNMSCGNNSMLSSDVAYDDFMAGLTATHDAGN